MRQIPGHGYPIEHRSLPCFRDLSAADVRRVWSRGEQVQFPRDWSLFWEPGPVDSVYLILHGTLNVTSGQGTSSVRGPGELVGEVDGPRGTDAGSRLMIVTTNSDVEALIMTSSNFSAACAEVPAFAAGIRASELAARQAR